MNPDEYAQFIEFTQTPEVISQVSAIAGKRYGSLANAPQTFIDRAAQLLWKKHLAELGAQQVISKTVVKKRVETPPIPVGPPTPTGKRKYVRKYVDLEISINAPIPVMRITKSETLIPGLQQEWIERATLYRHEFYDDLKERWKVLYASDPEAGFVTFRQPRIWEALGKMEAMHPPKRMGRIGISMVAFDEEFMDAQSRKRRTQTYMADFGKRGQRPIRISGGTPGHRAAYWRILESGSKASTSYYPYVFNVAGGGQGVFMRRLTNDTKFALHTANKKGPTSRTTGALGGKAYKFLNTGTRPSRVVETGLKALRIKMALLGRQLRGSARKTW